MVKIQNKTKSFQLLNRKVYLQYNLQNKYIMPLPDQSSHPSLFFINKKFIEGGCTKGLSGTQGKPGPDLSGPTIMKTPFLFVSSLRPC